jgi:hypothetical protein
VRLAAPRDVRVVARASAQAPLGKVEIVFNGAVVAAGTLSDDKLACDIDTRINVPRSGWISLRTLGGAGEAHTSPVYLEVAGRPAASREDAEFCLKLIDRLWLDLRQRDRFPGPEHKRHVETQLEEAREVYRRIAQSDDAAREPRVSVP